jgi:hypothetical protein
MVLKLSGTCALGKTDGVHESKVSRNPVVMMKAAEYSHYCSNDSNNNIHAEEIEIVRKNFCKESMVYRLVT